VVIEKGVTTEESSSSFVFGSEPVVVQSCEPNHALQRTGATWCGFVVRTQCVAPAPELSCSAAEAQLMAEAIFARFEWSPAVEAGAPAFYGRPPRLLIWWFNAVVAATAVGSVAWLVSELLAPQIDWRAAWGAASLAVSSLGVLCYFGRGWVRQTVLRRRLRRASLVEWEFGPGAVACRVGPRPEERSGWDRLRVTRYSDGFMFEVADTAHWVPDTAFSGSPEVLRLAELARHAAQKYGVAGPDAEPGAAPDRRGM
jgi:hypothetical protein